MAKIKHRRISDKIKNFATTIGTESHFVGEISGQDNCIVYGKVTGNSKLEGSLVIHNSGSWSGDILAHNVLISGEVEGNVAASNQLELLPSGRVTGRITCRHIAIAEGAVHRGEIRMPQETTVTRFEDRRG